MERGYVTEAEYQRSLAMQKSLRLEGINKPVGQILVDMGVISYQIRDKALLDLILQFRSALQDANNKLETRVKERTMELETAIEQLSSLNELKANLVANISHELRTPLTHLNGYLDLMVNGDIGPLTPEQLNVLGIVQHAAERLGHLIEDLILFSVSERDQIYLHIQPVDLAELCNGVLKRSISKAEEHHIQLSLEMDTSGIKVDADIEKISWVLIQLVDNGIKFTPAGGKVILRTSREDNFIHFQVQDTGIGIANDQVKYIFEPFRQLDGSSTRKAGGTGLGLALARRIVEAHGAVIHVHSEVGKGTLLEFLLKVHPG